MADLPWTPPDDLGDPEAGPHVALVGAFRLLAWDDGHWAIENTEDGEWLVECADKAPSLDAAKVCSSTRLRGLVLVTAEALGLLRIEVAP